MINRSKLSNSELVKGLQTQVGSQREEPFKEGTEAIIGLTGEAHRRTAATLGSTVESQGNVEDILAQLQRGAAELIGTKRAQEITTEERASYEQQLRTIVQSTSALIRTIEATFAGLKSGKVSPEERYAALEAIIGNRTDAVSSHVRNTGKEAITAMLKDATDKRKNLDTILDAKFPHAEGLEGASVAGARRIVKTLMQHLRSAVVGISERALKGFGTVPTELEEQDFADKEKTLAFVRTKLAAGNGLLIGIAGKPIYCHNSLPENQQKVEQLLNDATNPYSVIGSPIFTSDLAQLIEELPSGYEVTVHLPRGGTAVIKRNKTAPHAIAQESLKALGAESEEALKNNVLQYCYQPENISESA